MQRIANADAHTDSIRRDLWRTLFWRRVLLTSIPRLKTAEELHTREALERLCENEGLLRRALVARLDAWIAEDRAKLDMASGTRARFAAPMRHVPRVVPMKPPVIRLAA
jgi:hypothetical protein